MKTTLHLLLLTGFLATSQYKLAANPTEREETATLPYSQQVQAANTGPVELELDMVVRNVAIEIRKTHKNLVDNRYTIQSVYDAAERAAIDQIHFTLSQVEQRIAIIRLEALAEQKNISRKDGNIERVNIRFSETLYQFVNNLQDCLFKPKEAIVPALKEVNILPKQRYETDEHPTKTRDYYTDPMHHKDFSADYVRGNYFQDIRKADFIADRINEGRTLLPKLLAAFDAGEIDLDQLTDNLQDFIENNVRVRSYNRVHADGSAYTITKKCAQQMRAWKDKTDTLVQEHRKKSTENESYIVKQEQRLNKQEIDVNAYLTAEKELQEKTNKENAKFLQEMESILNDHASFSPYKIVMKDPEYYSQLDNSPNEYAPRNAVGNIVSKDQNGRPYEMDRDGNVSYDVT